MCVAMYVCVAIVILYHITTQKYIYTKIYYSIRICRVTCIPERARF